MRVCYDQRPSIASSLFAINHRFLPCRLAVSTPTDLHHPHRTGQCVNDIQPIRWPQSAAVAHACSYSIRRLRVRLHRTVQTDLQQCRLFGRMHRQHIFSFFCGGGAVHSPLSLPPTILSRNLLQLNWLPLLFNRLSLELVSVRAAGMEANDWRE